MSYLDGQAHLDFYTHSISNDILSFIQSHQVDHSHSPFPCLDQETRGLEQ